MPRGKRAQIENANGGLSGASVSDNKPESRIEDAQRELDGIESAANKPVSPIPTVSPIDLAGAGGSSGNADGSSEPVRRRGRQPGTKNKPRQEAPLDLAEYIAGGIASANSILAEITKVPEFNIDEARVKDIGEKTVALCNLYQKTFDPKKLAWFQLTASIGMAYVPVAIAVYNRPSPRKLEVIPKPETQQRTNGVDKSPEPISLREISPSQLNPEYPREDVE